MTIFHMNTPNKIYVLHLLPFKIYCIVQNLDERKINIDEFLAIRYNFTIQNFVPATAYM